MECLPQRGLELRHPLPIWGDMPSVAFPLGGPQLQSLHTVGKGCSPLTQAAYFYSNATVTQGKFFC